jgi:uncharacterized protein YeaO (DUF488 family)
MLKIKRVYERRQAGDGERILVDRFWPRGLSKRSARVDRWLRELAPSDALRRWFGHDPARWREFSRRYRSELRPHRQQLVELARAAQTRPITLLFGARDAKHNNAVALKRIIEGVRASSGRARRPAK